MIVQGMFRRKRPDLTCGALVELAIDSNTITEIILDINEEDNNSKHEDWNKGAVIGINYALAKLNLTDHHKISIKKIMGSESLTNPTIVAIAAFLGTFTGLGYRLNEAQFEELEALAMESLKKDSNHLPTKILK